MISTAVGVVRKFRASVPKRDRQGGPLYRAELNIRRLQSAASSPLQAIQNVPDLSIHGRPGVALLLGDLVLEISVVDILDHVRERFCDLVARRLRPEAIVRARVF